MSNGPTLLRLKLMQTLVGGCTHDLVSPHSSLGYASITLELYSTKISIFYFTNFLTWMKAEELAIAALKRSFEALNTHLASNTYLVGHSVTLADIVMTCNLFYGFKFILTKSFTSEFPHIERYFWTMANQPKIHKIFGDVEQAKSVPAVASKKPAAQPAKTKAKEEPKQVKKEEPKAKVELEEEEAPKPKAKNPLDLLPPSKMILDEWKRLYSNTKTNFREVAIKGILP